MQVGRINRTANTTELSGIYHIKNLVNGKRYIGSSVDIGSRWRHHKSVLNRSVHHSIVLQRAWRKYGESNFEFAILLLCNKDDVLKYEQAFLDKIQPEYNIATDVQASGAGRKVTPETKQKLREANVGKKLTEEHKRKIGESQIGKRLTEEHKRKISEGRTGVNMGHVAWNKGRAQSEETKRKLSEAVLGKKNHAYGKTLSEEHKRKISESCKARWANNKREVET